MKTYKPLLPLIAAFCCSSALYAGNTCCGSTKRKSYEEWQKEFGQQQRAQNQATQDQAVARVIQEEYRETNKKLSREDALFKLKKLKEEQLQKEWELQEQRRKEEEKCAPVQGSPSLETIHDLRTTDGSHNATSSASISTFPSTEFYSPAFYKGMSSSRNPFEGEQS